MADGISDETREWIEARRQPGNWFEIAADDTIPADITGWDVTLLHMFQISFSPEIVRRREAGTLPDDFVLVAAQQLQPPGKAPVVRLNSEVRIVAKMKGPVEPGTAVTMNDLDQIEGFDIPEDELDCGHFTMLWLGGNWRAAFDFRSGRANCGDTIRAAKEFIRAARHAAENGLARPAMDNLNSACELLSGAYLLLQDSPALKARSHDPVHRQINVERKMGNVDADFVGVFNKTRELRHPARYNAAAKVDPPSRSDIDIAADFADRLEKAVAHIGDRGD